jgi:hypothetical protein
MCSSDQLKIVRVIELFRDVLSKSVSSSSGRDAPTASIVRVGPQKVAHGTFMRHLLNSVKLLDLIKSVDAWRESSMQAEDLVFNDCSDRESVKEISEILPHVGISIFSKTLIIESVHLSDLSGLMVSSKDCYSILIPHFEGHK